MSVVFDGLLGRFDDVPDQEVPPPPEWLGLYMYGLFRPRLAAFLSKQGVEQYVVTSGYREPSKNEQVGGVKNSAHMHGLGADVVVGDWPGDLDAAALVHAWVTETGGYAASESDHIHFNYPRAWGWRVIRWLALAVVLLLLLLLLKFL